MDLKSAAAKGCKRALTVIAASKAQTSDSQPQNRNNMVSE
jgi:hypothetical protein